MKKNLWTSVRFAFKTSVPILCGYLFLGLAFGILLQSAGYNFIWAFFISLFVYAGSMQFVLVTFLLGGVNLATIAVMTLLINSRHMFYGLSFLQRFRRMGKAYPYMVFSLTDETYSTLCSLKCPPDVDEDRAMLFLAMFDHSYWILGSVLGALVGQLVTFNYAGIDFTMTALFVVIFLEQWKEYKSHLPAVVGMASATLFLLLLGPDNFILPALVVTVLALILLKDPINRRMETGDAR